MNLDNPITIIPPPYNDNNGNIIQSKPIIFNSLIVTYCDQPLNQKYFATIEKIPNSIQLYNKESYPQDRDITKTQAEQRLKEVLGDDPAFYLRSLFPRTMAEDPNGPGTILSKMIKTIGIHMTENCSCRRHALEMNKQGNDWCEKNIDIIVGWLRDEAKRRKLPFIDTIGKLMVNRAIKKSKKLLANEFVPENDEDLDNL